MKNGKRPSHADTSRGTHGNGSSSKKRARQARSNRQGTTDAAHDQAYMMQDSAAAEYSDTGHRDAGCPGGNANEVQPTACTDYLKDIERHKPGILASYNFYYDAGSLPSHASTTQCTCTAQGGSFCICSDGTPSIVLSESLEDDNDARSRPTRQGEIAAVCHGVDKAFSRP